MIRPARSRRPAHSVDSQAASRTATSSADVRSTQGPLTGLMEGLLEQVGLRAAREQQIVEAVPDDERDDEPEADGDAFPPPERGHAP